MESNDPQPKIQPSLITIIKPDVNTKNSSSNILYPIKPYHERYKAYMERRKQLFSVFDLNSKPYRKPKRSTIRLRRYYRVRKQNSKYIISTIVNNPNDKRFYAKVKFLNFTEYGLLDTGANISCIGADLANEDFSKYPDFVSVKTGVKTADGTFQRTLGSLNTEIHFRGQVHQLTLLIVPSITQRLILGLDFWKSFSLAPEIFDDSIVTNPSSPSAIAAINSSDCYVDENTKSINCISDTDSEKDPFSYPLSASQKSQLKTIIDLFPNFAKQGLGRTSYLKHHIDIGDAKPVKQRFYPVSPAVENLMYQEIDRMLSLGVIEPSSSPWSSPMRLVVKPNKVRLCLDARKLNLVTKKDAYPLPSIEGIFARLPPANIITKLDLKDAYWQIGLSDESKALTAFTVPGRPLYQFVVMPFGLCTAPQTMCRLIDMIIPPDLRYCIFGYLDDIVIVSEDFNSHLSVLVRIAQELRKANLTLNVDKSHFCVTQTKYLGYVIGNGGIQTDPDKVDSIVNWPVPKSVRQVRGFLGLAGWYRRFIENFSSITFPISETLSSKQKFKWTPEAQKSFEAIKTLLTTAPILSNPDFTKKFYLHCDASNYGIGAVLVQLDKDGNEKPIAFMSKKLNTAQRNYSVTERECLAAIEAIKKFRCYLELQDFEVVTDHSSLLWLMKQPDLTGRLARWVFKFQPFKFTISHRKGKDHIVPDSLSRIHCDEISALEETSPEIDLNADCFDDFDYEKLKHKIRCNESKYPDVKIVDKFVYIRTEHYTGDPAQENSAWKLWIPEGLRSILITRFHDSPEAAHGGMGKTLDLIRRNFFWPGMVTDIRDYVRNCETCKTTKHPNVTLKPEMGKPAIISRPFQRLYVDILGPYPRSKNGYVGIFIVLDHLTKYHWLCPLKKFTTVPIKEFLLKQIFHAFGVPEQIISDNGSQFKSNEFNSFLTKFGIQHIYTALYSPQANASERVNRSIIASIRAYLKSDQRLWDEHLSYISCALRNSVHQALKCSPYFATFGFNMVTHGDSYALLKNLGMLNEPHVLINREDQLQLIRNELKNNITKSYYTNRDQYNLRSRPISYNEGQIVYRRNFAQSSAEKNFNAKLAPVFLPSKIRKKVGNVYYELEDLNGKFVGTYHAKDLKP